MRSRKLAKGALFVCFLSSCIAVDLDGGQPPNGEGIAVGRPKVFDNRSLVLMLDQLSEQLKSVQFIDQAQLAASLGFTQGYQSQDVSRNLSVSTVPTPQLSTTLAPGANGNLSPTQETVTRAPVNPAVPQLPDLMSAPNYQPKYGTSASDLLADQVNLTYQIFNLRMLLERSLSDRIWTDSGKSGPRLQAVLGFNISLDPPKEAHDSAAVVEITLVPEKPANRISVVALMPQEKTYNSAALDSHSNAFGGSAVVNMITIGYSERRRGQTFYLYRDSDTISFERMENPPEIAETEKPITFGWEFRPVLGRRSVSPGLRQMFAVIALPNSDTFKIQSESTAHFQVFVRTYWRKYDKSTLTTIVRHQFPKATPLCESLCDVPLTSTVQTVLAPKVKSIQWIPTDDKSAVVSIEGENFFTGTSVLLGSTVHDTPGNGLVIKSDQSLQLRTTITDLLSADAMLNGRYGSSVFLQMEPSTMIPDGIGINSMLVKPYLGTKTSNLMMEIYDRRGVDLNLHDFLEIHTPVVVVGGTPVTAPYSYQQQPCDLSRLTNGSNSRHCVLIQIPISNDLIQKEVEVTIKYPFRGPKWKDSALFYNPQQAVQVVRIGGDKLIKFGVVGAGFNADWKVQLDKVYSTKDPSALLTVDGETLLTFQVTSDALKSFKNILVLPQHGQPFVLPIPAEKATPPEPKINPPSGVGPSAIQYSASSVTIDGSGLEGIKMVTFEREELQFKTNKKDCKSEDGACKIDVFLTRHVTAKAGKIQILLKTEDGTIFPAQVTIDPAPKSPGSTH